MAILAAHLTQLKVESEDHVPFHSIRWSAGIDAFFLGKKKLVGGFNPFENISQIGSSPQVRVKITNVWNHHPEKHLTQTWYHTEHTHRDPRKKTRAKSAETHLASGKPISVLLMTSTLRWTLKRGRWTVSDTGDRFRFFWRFAQVVFVPGVDKYPTFFLNLHVIVYNEVAWYSFLRVLSNIFEKHRNRPSFTRQHIPNRLRFLCLKGNYYWRDQFFFSMICGRKPSLSEGFRG